MQSSEQLVEWCEAGMQVQSAEKKHEISGVFDDVMQIQCSCSELLATCL